MGYEKHPADNNGRNPQAVRNTTFGVSLLALLAVLALAEPAAAQLRICNQSNETISMAVAYHDVGQPQDQLTSRGWYVAKPGECPVVVGGPLQARYYYLRGHGADGTTWGDGGIAMCTTSDRFTYTGGGNCERFGFQTENFLTIDSGSSSAMTFTLTPAPATPPRDTGRDGVADLRVSWRYSVLEDGTMVMQLHNPRPTTVDFQMRCFTRSGASKLLTVSVFGKSMAEVGFMQGWPGNFETGEHCEAYSGGNVVWTARAPSR